MTISILHFYICKLDNVSINKFFLWGLFAGPPKGVFFNPPGDISPSTHKPDTHSPVTSAHILFLSFFSNHLMQQKSGLPGELHNFHLHLWQCYPHDNRLTVATHCYNDCNNQPPNFT